MNENLKHSIVNIFGSTWTIPAAIAISFFIQEDSRSWFFVILTSISIILILVLSYAFFGSSKLLLKVYATIKNNFFNMASLGIVVFGIYNILFNLGGLSVQQRALILLFILAAWTFLSLKIRNFSNFQLIKSFFKEDLILMDSWIASETNTEQQTDYREVSLNGKPLEKLVFTIRPASPFWRTGFKLTDSNGTILPLRTKNSLLFHLLSTGSGDRFGITAYINGEWVESLNKTLPFNRQNPINIKFEVNRNNFIKCYVNDQVEFEPAESIDPRILKKAFLAAWGDGHNMRVEFDSIGFLKKK